MPSLGTSFGPPVPNAGYRTASGDFIAPSVRLEPPPIPPEKVAEVACALFEGFFTADAAAAEPPPAPTKPKSEADYLTVREAAERARRAVGTIYNAISDGSLRKQEGSYMVLISPAELDRWLTTKRPTRKEASAAKRKQAEAEARKQAKKKTNRR